MAGSTACNDDKKTASNGELSAEQTQLAAALCRDAHQCPRAYDDFYPFDSESACLQFFETTDWEELFDQELRMDASTVNQCVSVIDDRCFEYSAIWDLSGIPECMGLFDGGFENGERCDWDDECASGYCDINQRDRPACGTCSTPPQALGETCSRWQGECPKLTSDGKRVGCRYDEALEDHTCQILGSFNIAQKGEACDRDSYAYGPSPTVCATGLYCNEAGTCVEGAAIGEACTNYSENYPDYCVSGAYCDIEDDETGTGTCKKISFISAADASCDPLGGIECDISKGLFCHWNLEICVERAGTHQYCLLNSDCEEGKYCSYDSEQCTALREDGRRCDGNDECKSNFCDYAHESARDRTCLPVDICD